MSELMSGAMLTVVTIGWVLFVLAAAYSINRLTRQLDANELSPWKAGGLCVVLAAGFIAAFYGDAPLAWLIVTAGLFGGVIFALFLVRRWAARRQTRASATHAGTAASANDESEVPETVTIRKLQPNLARGRDVDGLVYVNNEDVEALAGRQGWIWLLPWSIAKDGAGDGRKAPLFGFRDREGSEIWLYDVDEIVPVATNI